MRDEVSEERRQSDVVVARLETWSANHEKQCDERQQSIMERIGRIEMLLIGAAGTLICGMAALLAKAFA